MSRLARLVSNWSNRRTPITVEVTPGRPRSHASATCAAVVPISCAMASTASITPNSASPGARPRVVSTDAVPAREYLPDNQPPFNGDQGSTPIPMACAIGISSPSDVRSSNEYSSCSAMIGAHPRIRAIVAASAVAHAGTSENPT